MLCNGLIAKYFALAPKVKRFTSRRDARQHFEESCKAVAALVSPTRAPTRAQAHGRVRVQVWENNAVLETLRKTFYELRKLPLLDLRVPLVVLVGMPNVGKSSIVSHISTGNPLVRHYPFTTRIAKVTSGSSHPLTHSLANSPLTHSPTHLLTARFTNPLTHPSTHPTMFINQGRSYVPEARQSTRASKTHLQKPTRGELYMVCVRRSASMGVCRCRDDRGTHSRRASMLRAETDCR